MIPARSNQPPFNFPGPHLELLAEMEHDRWMKAKIEAGWRYAPKTNKAKRLHLDMLPWRRLLKKVRSARYTLSEDAKIGTNALSRTAKEKDRRLIKAIPKILSEAGYAIVKVY